MTPATIALLVQFLQLAITETPELVADLQKLFSSGAPTQADFDGLIASVKAESYGKFVPASQLPPTETSQ